MLWAMCKQDQRHAVNRDPDKYKFYTVHISTPNEVSTAVNYNRNTINQYLHWPSFCCLLPPRYSITWGGGRWDRPQPFLPSPSGAAAAGRVCLEARLQPRCTHGQPRRSAAIGSRGSCSRSGVTSRAGSCCGAVRTQTAPVRSVPPAGSRPRERLCASQPHPSREPWGGGAEPGSGAGLEALFAASFFTVGLLNLKRVWLSDCGVGVPGELSSSLLSQKSLQISLFLQRQKTWKLNSDCSWRGLFLWLLLD